MNPERRAASAKRGPDTEHAKNIRFAAAKGYRVTDEGRLIAPSGTARSPAAVGSTPYYRFSIRIGARYRSVALHKFAAYQWFGEPALEAGIHVRHVDGNSLNNSRANLALGSPRDNILDRPKEDRVAHARKAARRLRKLSDDQVRDIRTRHAGGARCIDIAGALGLAKSTISYIVNRKTYQEVS